MTLKTRDDRTPLKCVFIYFFVIETTNADITNQPFIREHLYFYIWTHAWLTSSFCVDAPVWKYGSKSRPSIFCYFTFIDLDLFVIEQQALFRVDFLLMTSDGRVLCPLVGLIKI